MNIFLPRIGTQMRDLFAVSLLAVGLCLSAGVQARPMSAAPSVHGFAAFAAINPVEAANRKGSKRVGGKNSKGKGGKYVGGRPGKK
jgi:hypothetical protein